MDSQQGSTLTLTKEKELQDTCTLPSAASGFREAIVSTEAQTSMAPLLQALGTPGQQFAYPPRVALPIPPIHRDMHSKASQVRLPSPPTPFLTSWPQLSAPITP
jgi:hypothetical protein